MHKYNVHFYPYYCFSGTSLYRVPGQNDFLCLATGRALTTISQKRKITRNFVPHNWAKEKSSGNWFRTIQGQKKHLDDFWKFFLRNSVPFRSEFRNRLFRIHIISRQEHFFPRNYENCSESIRRNIFGQFFFDGSPNPDLIKAQSCC